MKNIIRRWIIAKNLLDLDTNPSIFSRSSRSRRGRWGSLRRRLTSLLGHVLRGRSSADGDTACRHRGTHSGHHYLLCFPYHRTRRELPSRVILINARALCKRSFEHFTDNPIVRCAPMSPSSANRRSDWRNRDTSVNNPRWTMDERNVTAERVHPFRPVSLSVERR